MMKCVEVLVKTQVRNATCDLPWAMDLIKKSQQLKYHSSDAVAYKLNEANIIKSLELKYIIRVHTSITK